MPCLGITQQSRGTLLWRLSPPPHVGHQGCMWVSSIPPRTLPPTHFLDIFLLLLRFFSAARLWPSLCCCVLFTATFLLQSFYSEPLLVVLAPFILLIVLFLQGEKLDGAQLKYLIRKLRLCFRSRSYSLFSLIFPFLVSVFMFSHNRLRLQLQLQLVPVAECPHINRH